MMLLTKHSLLKMLKMRDIRWLWLITN